jgi:hypothetical protein
MKATCSTGVIAIIALLNSGTAVNAQSRTPSVPLNYFGVARYHYEFLPEDAVFYWDDIRGTEAASLQYARMLSDRPVSLYYAVEFTLATVNRAIYIREPSQTFNKNSTIFGSQASVGPRVKVGPLAVFGLGGLNMVHVTEEVGTAGGSGASRTRWVGTAGISQYWAAQYNQMNRTGSSSYTFPAYHRYSPSATAGVSLDIRRVRVSYELVRVFASPVRTDNRIGVGVTY